MGGSGSPDGGGGGYSRNDAVSGVNADELFGSAGGAAGDASPWYLKPWVLALWGVAVVILIAAIIFGLAELAVGNGRGPATTPSPAPSSPRPSVTRPSATTTPAQTTTSAVPPETTATEPPPPVTTWTQQHPRRHWWNGNLPTMPTLPDVPNLPHVPGRSP
jgi:hypothetical protein